jgi:hypothetical protein
LSPRRKRQPISRLRDSISPRSAEKGFRRAQGYQHLADLIVALEQHHKSLQKNVDRLMKAA